MSSDSSPPRARFPKRVLLLACLVTVAARTLLAMSRMDEVELEVYSGSIASAILGGMPLDPTQLPIIVHLRGSYLVGLLLVPLFAVFGASLWVLKATAIAWTAATVALWVLVLQRTYGSVAALVGGLVYAFLPPSFQMVDVTLLGSHGETILFIMAALWFLVSREFSLLGNRKCGFAFGALMGAGLLFSMQFLAVIPALIIAWWAHEARLARSAPSASSAARRSALKDSVLFGLPLLLGAALYLKKVGPNLELAMWWQFALVGLGFTALGCTLRRLRVLTILGGLFVVSAPMAYITRSTVVVNQRIEDRLLPEGTLGCLAKFWDAITATFPQTWLFQDFGGPLARGLFAAAVLVGLAYTLRRAARCEALPLFLLFQPLFFFCLYAATNLELRVDAPLDGMGSRYVMPVLACVSGWIAIAAHDLWAQRKRALGVCVAATPCCAGLLGLWPLLEPSAAFRQPPARGDRLHFFSAHFAYAGGDKLLDRMRWVATLDPQWAAFRPGYYRETFIVERLRPTTLEQFHRALGDASLIPGELGAHLMYDLGCLAFDNKLLTSRAAAEVIVKQLQIQKPAREMPRGPDGALLPEPNAVWFARGYGSRGLRAAFLDAIHPQGSGVFNGKQFLDTLPDAWRGYAVQGAGFATGDVLTAYNSMPLRYMLFVEAGFEGVDLENFFISLALGFRTHYDEDRYWVPPFGELKIERVLGDTAARAFHMGLLATHERFPPPR